MRRPNVPKYGRELMLRVEELAAFDLEWRVTGGGHLQPLRVREGGPAEPIVDGAGRPIVGSLTPSNPTAAQDAFLRDLRRVGVIRDHRPPKARNRRRRAPDVHHVRQRQAERREMAELLDVISGFPIERVRCFANAVAVEAA